ncbi:MAG: hypothetical protein LUD00_03610 [Prevotellaceae bacterium]|nr:hypothetical protein [Prevotellaceae bacterium]
MLSSARWLSKCVLSLTPSPRIESRFRWRISDGNSRAADEILKCAMYLFMGYLDGATRFAQSCGGGGSDSSLPWGRKDNEDDRRFAYRCMMQAHRMMKPTSQKRGINGKR